MNKETHAEFIKLIEDLEYRLISYRHDYDNFIDGLSCSYHRYIYWKKVKIRRWLINHHLYRMRCVVCCKLINYYSYEGIYDICTDCAYEAHPR